METLANYIDKGGVIILILIGFNAIGFSVMIWKFIQIQLFDSKINQTESDIREIIPKFSENEKELLKAEITIRIFHLDKGMSVIQTIATTAPLLGLLGTVLGVLSAFEAISEHGLGNPEVFANGISVALITTVAGLIVAIPHYIGYNFLVKLIDFREIILQKRLSK